MSIIEVQEQASQAIPKVVHLLDPSGEDFNTFAVACAAPLVLRNNQGVYCDKDGRPLPTPALAAMADVGIIG